MPQSQLEASLETRFGASRLVHIAEVLSTTVQEPADIKVKGVAKGNAESISEILVEPYALELLERFNTIENRNLKHAIVRFVEGLASAGPTF